MRDYRQAYVGKVQRLKDQILIVVEQSEREKHKLSVKNAEGCPSEGGDSP